MNIKPSAISLFLFLVTVFSCLAQAGEVNTGYFGNIAIKGYDAVAYHTDRKATVGSKEYSYDWLGATWLFASRDHYKLFVADPVKYAPRYGGHCAAGVSFGESTVNIDPEAWSIVDGKLYLNFSKSVTALWKDEKLRDEQIKRADANWEKIKAKLKAQ